MRALVLLALVSLHSCRDRTICEFQGNVYFKDVSGSTIGSTFEEDAAIQVLLNIPDHSKILSCRTKWFTAVSYVESWVDRTYLGEMNIGKDRLASSDQFFHSVRLSKERGFQIGENIVHFELHDRLTVVLAVKGTVWVRKIEDNQR